LPEAPLADFCEDVEDCICDKCGDLEAWYKRFLHTVDNIVVRSNIHKCYRRRDNTATDKTSAEKQGKQARIPKLHATGKGCINKDGICTAHFPRDIYLKTTVNLHTGQINLKKQEK
jgi:hypothetical protein